MFSLYVFIDIFIIEQQLSFPHMNCATDVFRSGIHCSFNISVW